MTVHYLGHSYGDDTDWLAVIREAARYPFGPSWLRADIDVASGLAEIAAQLDTLAARRNLANAGLEIVEHGSSPERVAVRQLPWELADDAVARSVRLIQTDRERLAELRGVPNVIWRLLRAHPRDEQVLAALRAEGAQRDPDPWIMEMLQTRRP